LISLSSFFVWFFIEKYYEAGAPDEKALQVAGLQGLTQSFH